MIRFSNLLPTAARLAVVAMVAAGVELASGTLATTPAVADPSSSDWARLRTCESSGDYASVDPNGHYGAYQFDIRTWISVGGSGRPNQASPAEQDFRALYLYRMRGWQPWQCASKLRLRPDVDAASHRAPTAADVQPATPPVAPPAAQPPLPPAAPAPTTPPWPGRTYRYGACDAALRPWQLRMNTFGFHFTGTGCYFGKTRAAVLAVQRANGIPANGRLGEATWRAAWQGHAPKSPRF